MWSAAMDVGEWLKEIGLGQYEATFRLVWASSALSASSPDPDVHCNRLLRPAIEPSQPSCSPSLPAV
jgi:hypothetical protein